MHAYRRNLKLRFQIGANLGIQLEVESAHVRQDPLRLLPLRRDPFQLSPDHLFFPQRAILMTDTVPSA
jgi:hypothetical protein